MLAGAAAVTLLSGCGGLSGPPFGLSEGGTPALKATSGDLLYVANQGGSKDVSILTFPQGARVAKISSIGSPSAICSDTSGNVWVSAYDDSTHKFHLYKFVHGGTKPVETLPPVGSYLEGCAVDPTTGDVAGLVAMTGASGEIAVWPGGRKGKAIVYPIGFDPLGGSYDNQGNLFVDGLQGSTTFFVFAELPKGSKQLTYITLDKAAAWGPGSVQWDGKNISVGLAPNVGDHGAIYRVQVAGKLGKVVGIVHLPHLGSFPRFWIQGDKVVATRRAYTVRRIGLYDYPSGGKPIELLSGFHNPEMTVSVAPK
jgi:hypothetical protein